MKTKAKDASVLSVIDRVAKFFSRHIYLCVALACACSHFLTYSQNETFSTCAKIFSSIFFAILLSVALNRLYKPPKDSILMRIAICSMVIALTVLLSIFYELSQRSEWYILILGALLIVAFFIAFRDVKDKEKLIAFLIIAFAFLIRFYYVYTTTIEVRQHDPGSFGTVGHLGYIQFLYDNKWLPQFDPRPYWQFYHPPLHHALSAILLGISKDFFCVSPHEAHEGIQSLTLLYSMLILVTLYEIMKMLKIKGFALYSALAIIAFHPSFILLSGSVNNDVLSIALMTLSVMFTLKWLENKTIKRIIPVALSVGLGMLAKLSSALVAVSIGVIMIIELIKSRKSNWKGLLAQYGILGAISFPLGLGYQIRNLIRFGVPITYVQELPIDIDQYIGMKPFLYRIYDFSPYQLANPFLSWENGVNGYNEFNPLIALFKTAIFEETICDITFPSGTLLGVIAQMLFWVSIVLGVYAFVSLVIYTIKKLKEELYKVLLTAGFYLVTLISYYSMCMEYPFVCTMSFRYATPLIFMGAVGIGLLLKELKDDKKGKIIRYTSFGVAMLFSALSVISYIAVCGVK